MTDRFDFDLTLHLSGVAAGDPRLEALIDHARDLFGPAVAATGVAVTQENA